MAQTLVDWLKVLEADAARRAGDGKWDGKTEEEWREYFAQLRRERGQPPLKYEDD
jgi:hypothetical protein